ncbi:MAG: uroporphyrinogen-III C-methyltransferase [Planctomycetota bacterium]|jgi:uroporphyrinogen III methyltransferase/synthase
MSNRKDKGKVYLVGAGPGDPALITVRAAELVGLADCIICDKLVNPILLKYARSDAELINTPKRIGLGSCSQQQINDLIVQKASQGKVVVRLKGGDPCIFGRGSEEATILVEAGISFEIVPGITASIAGAEYSGIMLTDRRYSSQVCLVTGHEAEGKNESDIDWRWFAKFNGTIVLYMAVGNLHLITAELLQGGLPSETPTAAIRNATLTTQHTVKTTLGKIVEARDSGQIVPPSIIIIGPGAAGDPKLEWFTSKPLFGQNVVITRDDVGNDSLAEEIIKRGGNPISYPTIKIRSLTDSNHFLNTLAEMKSFDWIIFTSVNGVAIFFEALKTLEKDARVFASAKLAAIGPRTAQKLAQYSIKADFVPTKFTSKELAVQLIDHVNVKNKKVLLLRSQQASDELPGLLENAETQITETHLYTIEPVKNDPTQLTEQIRSEQIQWITFASPSSVKNFFDQIMSDTVNTSTVKIASIGPVTTKQLKELNIKVDLEPEEQTFDALLDAIEAQK